MASRLTLPVRPEEVLIIGTGGESRTRQTYVDGKRTEALAEHPRHPGSPLHRLSGISVSVSGLGLDGASVETLTPLADVPAGAVFKAEGAVEVTTRAEGKAGFNGGAPRGELAISVFIERLTPVGSVADLVSSSTPAKAAPAKEGAK